MIKKREKDEHVERLYYMEEDKADSIDALKTDMNGNYDSNVVDQLSAEDMVELSDDGSKIKLTQKGQSYGRQIIRAHRLAERLLHDVLGGDFEHQTCRKAAP